ncbi:hypothetical protein [Okeania sp. SIO2B3]|uniref:hypothetical protein n=1 Tax=Okeania sp. SIO2B3 TaxID=2607784 RepID=UPI0025F37DC6|nr:hypothetical protein [Okeania sp. SIO2B3]
MLQTKCKNYKFKQVTIDRTCSQTLSVAIRKPRYGHNYNLSVCHISAPSLVSLLKTSNLNQDMTATVAEEV